MRGNEDVNNGRKKKMAERRKQARGIRGFRGRRSQLNKGKTTVGRSADWTWVRGRRRSRNSGRRQAGGTDQNPREQKDNDEGAGSPRSSEKQGGDWANSLFASGGQGDSEADKLKEAIRVMEERV